MPGAHRQSKLIGVDAAAALVASGMHLAIGGIWNQNVPAALLRGVVRSGIRDLRVSSGPAAGLGIDLLLRAGIVTEALVANITFEHLGLAPGMRRCVEDGTVRFIEADEAVLIGGYKAAAAGLPATIICSILGTEASQRSELLGKVALSTDEDVGIAPAIQPDVAFVHTMMSDEYGNAVSGGAVFVDRLLAKAARRVVVSTEAIVTNEVIREQPARTTIPSFMVDAVVHAPRGAHPCGSHGVYDADEDALRRYLKAAGDEGNHWDRYVAREIMVSHEEYVATLGDPT